MTDALAQTLLNAIPITIGAIATAVVTIRSANKKTDESAKQTNELVTSTKEETGKKLDAVHETVNGNYTTLQSKHDAAVAENIALREQLAHAMKRSTDRAAKKKGAP